MNDKKNILIVCSGFYPSNTPRANRATELTKEFARQGHRVTVLLHDRLPVHDTFEKEHAVTIRTMGNRKWKNHDFGKSKIGYFLTRLWFRLLLHAFEYPAVELCFMTARALKKEKGYDTLISIAVPYPLHWGVARVWNKNQQIANVWIADCGDPYYGCVTDTFRKWPHFAWVEKWFMHRADFITIPVESARSAYFPEFHPKIKVIPQGFSFGNTDYPSLYRKNSIPHFIYAGGFIPGIRDPNEFLEYLTTVENNFRFYIYTNARELVAPFKQTLGDKLIISDFIPRDELLTKMAGMDFLVNFDNNTESALPSKLIDYGIVGRPVLNIQKKLDTHTIQLFLRGDYSAQMQLPIIDNYRIENVSKKFLELVQQ